ncbi:hypothetical protein [Flavobacterium beibuense]|uniref:hypothetical protein n=1 Tax=Flavobacterium beibuense TaxID=657326 RepID=UPI003A9105CA
MALKRSDSGSWNSDTTYIKKGGQNMTFKVKNINLLGTTLVIESNLGGTKSMIIPPQMTMNFEFTCFGAEPMNWSFDISTSSDAFIVTWELYSTWVAGDPSNS